MFKLLVILFIVKLYTRNNIFKWILPVRGRFDFHTRRQESAMSPKEG